MQRGGGVGGGEDHSHPRVKYFIRASFGNPKGIYGAFSASRPKSRVPSSWRSVDQVPANVMPWL